LSNNEEMKRSNSQTLNLSWKP